MVTDHYKFTYVILYRHKPDRLKNLRRVIEWVQGFAGVEIIIIEQDNVSKIKDLNIRGYRHIFVKNDGLFNRSWGFNVAAKFATTNIICCGDSDLIMNPEQFLKSIEKINKGEVECISPYNEVIELTPQEASSPIDSLYKINRPGRGVAEGDVRKINLCGGLVILTKDAFDKVGGWPEECRGWGAEDNVMTHKVVSFLKYDELPYKCYHLPHAQDQIDQSQYSVNFNFMQKIVAMDKPTLANYINSVMPVISHTNKYDI